MTRSLVMTLRLFLKKLEPMFMNHCLYMLTQLKFPGNINNIVKYIVFCVKMLTIHYGKDVHVYENH